MSNKGILTFIVYFLFVIYIVPGVQAVIEYRGGDTGKDAGLIEKIARIQPFDFLTDTFITPLKRTNDVADSLQTLASSIDKARGEVRKAGEMLAKARARQSEDENGDVDQTDVSVEDLWYDTDAEASVANALVATKKALKAARFINRHVIAKDSNPTVKKLVTIETDLDVMIERIGFDLEFAEADSILSAAGEVVSVLVAKNPRRGNTAVAGLAVNAFFTSTAFSSKYIRAYETEMEDSSVFANAIRPWMQFAQYIFVRDTGPEAIGGKKGWLFFKPGFDFLVNPSIYDERSKMVDANDGTNKAFTDDPIAVMIDFREQLKKRGIDLLVVPVPGKPSVYPDMLSSAYGPEDAGTISHSPDLIRKMRSAGIETVDLFAPFAKERLNDAEAGDSMYLSTDTHWRYRGLKTAAKAVADRVKQYPWFDKVGPELDLVLEKMMVDRDGDIGAMTRLPNLDVRDLNLSFPLEPTECYQVQRVWRNEDGEIARKSEYNTVRETMNSQILVIGDSFSRIYQDDLPKSAGWTSHLAYELGVPVGLIYSDGGASTLVRQRLARRVREKEMKGKRSVLSGKKLLVWEFVERDFRFGAEGWQQVSLSSDK